MSRFLFLLVLALALPAQAARFTVDASNPGAIDGSGRDLHFDLGAIHDPIVSATLQLDISYSRARELNWSLVDNSGVVVLPLAMMSGVSSAVTMNGRYRISDGAATAWALAAPVSGNLPTAYPARAFQFGQSGVCTNLLARYLEFDLDRNLPLTLRISRLGSASGSGAISSARLVIDTSAPDELLATGMEEPEHAPMVCQRPSLDVVLNGGSESPTRSPLTLLDYTGAPDWSIRQFDPPQDFGPVAFGVGPNTQAYPGRFGGRSRLNLGFWDASTGTLNFTTGSGGRSLSLPGDWASTPHFPIPGDYDGDGITDLAMAFLGDFGGQPRYYARILFSRDYALRDLIIDPRAYDPANHTSANIGFGAGQDADQNGADEITLYAQRIDGNMRLIQFVVDPLSLTPIGLGGPAWGVLGDRLVLGNWTAGSSGNQFGLMVARETATAWEWYLFPNGTPISWGLPGDFPVSINVDLDRKNDIAVYRPSDQKLYVIRSSDGQQLSLGPFGSVDSIPIGYLLGTIAPLPF